MRPQNHRPLHLLDDRPLGDAGKSLTRPLGAKRERDKSARRTRRSSLSWRQALTVNFLACRAYGACLFPPLGVGRDSSSEKLCLRLCDTFPPCTQPSNQNLHVISCPPLVPNVLSAQIARPNHHGSRTTHAHQHVERCGSRSPIPTATFLWYTPLRPKPLLERYLVLISSGTKNKAHMRPRGIP